VLGSTTFTKITNTCAQGCGTNDLLCGSPVFTLKMVDGSTVPPFLNTLSVGTDITHSAQTFDINDEGVYELELHVFLDKSNFGNSMTIPPNV
jgi:hypothetical protein